DAGASADYLEARSVPKYLRARAPHDDSEARKIRRLAGARHAPADWIERARIVALSWDGLAVPAIAAKTGRHENTVRRWLRRFNAAGLDGLGNQPGPGRKRRRTEARWTAGVSWFVVLRLPGLAGCGMMARAARDAGVSLGYEPVQKPGAGTLTRRVASCCLEHAGQTSRSRTDPGPRAAR